MVDELNPTIVQLVRSLVQVAWSALLGITVVAQVIEQTGLDPEVAKGVAVTVSLAIVLGLSRALAPRWPIFGWLLNGINRDIEYTKP